MSENSKIEWCDHTFNPWEGCTACDHCYAEARNLRFNGSPVQHRGVHHLLRYIKKHRPAERSDA